MQGRRCAPDETELRNAAVMPQDRSGEQGRAARRRGDEVDRRWSRRLGDDDGGWRRAKRDGARCRRLQGPRVAGTSGAAVAVCADLGAVCRLRHRGRRALRTHGRTEVGVFVELCRRAVPVRCRGEQRREQDRDESDPGGGTWCWPANAHDGNSTAGKIDRISQHGTSASEPVALNRGPMGARTGQDIDLLHCSITCRMEPLCCEQAISSHCFN